MRLKVVQIPPEKWAKMSESAHLATFGKHKPASWDRISYALLVVAGEVPVVYVTVRESDPQTVYWQFGGSLPPARGSVVAWRAFQTVLAWQLARVERVTMLVENTNAPMLKMAMKGGFLISGVRYYKGLLVELTKERGHGDYQKLRTNDKRLFADQETPQRLAQA